MIDKELNDIVRQLETVAFHQTMDAQLQWYYAEEGLYVFKINAGTKDEYLVLIHAESLEAARSKVNVTIFQHVPKGPSLEETDPRYEIKRLNAKIDELQGKNNEMFLKIREVYGVMRGGYYDRSYEILSIFFDKLIHEQFESEKSVNP